MGKLDPEERWLKLLMERYASFKYSGELVKYRRSGLKVVGRINLYTNEESDTLMTETLKSKMKLFGLEDETLKIAFDKSYSKAKTKLITYNRINSKASLCPLIIKGKPKTKAFAWDVGIGNSTGIGFGSLI